MAGVSKVSSKLAAKMLAHPSIGSLTVEQVGAAFLIADLFACRANEGKVHRSAIVEMLVQRGCDERAAQSVIDCLELRRIVAISRTGFVSLPAIIGAIAEVKREFERRQAGWETRKGKKPGITGDRQIGEVSALPPVGVAVPDTPPAPLEPMPLFADVASPNAAPVARKGRRVSAGENDGSEGMVWLICDDGQKAEVTQAYIDQLTAAYPSLDVKNELLRAGVWLNANPRRRKTFTGLKRFVSTWLNNALNGAAARAAAVGGQSPQKSGFGSGGKYEELFKSAESPGDDSLDHLATLTTGTRWRTAQNVV